MSSGEEDELPCDISGLCEAAPGDRGITNCIYCGKELHEKDGWWWTWDAYMVENPQPQCPVL